MPSGVYRRANRNSIELSTFEVDLRTHKPGKETRTMRHLLNFEPCMASAIMDEKLTRHAIPRPSPLLHHSECSTLLQKYPGYEQNTAS